MGLRMYSFIDVMIDCLNYVPSVALSSAAFNPSWHLTAVGAVQFRCRGSRRESAVAQLFSLGCFAMKAFLITTGVLFGLMAVVHIWRAIVEWPHSTVSFGFVLGMSALIAVPGVLSWWAFWCLRNLSDDQSRNKSTKKKGSGDSAT